MKINKEQLYKLYMQSVDSAADDNENLCVITPEHLISMVVNILENQPTVFEDTTIPDNTEYWEGSYFNYIVSGNGGKCFAAKTPMNFFEFRDFIRDKSKKIHPESLDTVLSMGARDFVNPIVMTAGDYLNAIPYIFEV